MQVKNKTAIITGGGTGVGRATTLSLAKLGCNVVINYSRSRDEAEQTTEDARALGVQAIAVQADVTDDAACRAMVDQTMTTFGRLDVLVNNAGTTHFIEAANLDAVTDQVWKDIMSVNVKGAFQCARAAFNPMQDTASDGGEIINISSIAAFRGKGSSIPYCVSKGALNTLTLSLADTFAPSIRVNAVAPGYIDSRWIKNAVGDKYDQVMKEAADGAPLKSVSSTQDIADAILSLITGSDKVTGQVLVCDAGWLLNG